MAVQQVVFGWCFVLCFGLSSVVHSLNAKLAHELIEQQAPQLLGDGSQLVSIYYFGQSHSKTVVGLERVGDDHLPIRWLVIIESQTVKGWYYPSEEFPVRFKDGMLSFPKGSGIPPLLLLTDIPNAMVHNDHVIPFYQLTSHP